MSLIVYCKKIHQYHHHVAQITHKSQLNQKVLLRYKLKNDIHIHLSNNMYSTDKTFKY